MNRLNVFVVFIFLLTMIACTSKNEKYKSQQVNYYFEKINSESVKEPEKIKYIDTLYDYLIADKNDSINRTILFDVAREYFKLDHNETYLKAVQDLYELAVAEKDTSHIARSFRFIGDYYENETMIDSAFKYYSKSEKLYKKINDTLNIGRLALYKAGILYDAGIFTESEIETAVALRLLIKSGHDRLIYEGYNLMALNIKELNEYSDALKYFNMALNQLSKMEKSNYPKHEILRSRVSVYNNMGRTYEKARNYEKAINLYSTGLQTQNLKQSYPKLYAMLLNNLAYAKMKAGNTNGLEELFLESLKIRDSLQIMAGIVSGKIKLGEYYLFKKDTLKGIAHIKNGYDLAKNIESSYDIKNALKLLSENDIENRNYYGDLYIKVNDSLQNIERITRNKFARIAYETDQIEEHNEILSKKNKNILIGSGISILFLCAFFAVYRLKTKNKELLFIQEQQESNEKIYQLMLEQQQQNESIRNEERNRIAMELHDGIVNRIFTTRFNLMQLQPEQSQKKELLVKELVNTEAEIRKVSHDLQQNLFFKDNSFQEAITHLVETQQNEFHTKFDLSIDKYIDWSLVASENKIHIYRIIQEALHNVNKYSKAEKCFVFILKTGDKITFRVLDNGIGFNPDKIKPGIGLKNMKQRTKSLNGKFKISSDDEGTTVEIIF
jgi:signal transduction histidine kinase